jgi:outer membrane protein OmpA-like peptidoglycan-associated protein
MALAPGQVFAQSATPQPTGGQKVASAAPITAVSAVEATAAVPADAGVRWEDSWEPWNTGGEEANLGFAFFGHLGLGHRFDEAPPGTQLNTRDGLRFGITGIFRPIRWFGFGVGYEHADLERDRKDVPEERFETVFRDINTLWVDARVYPLRFDPFALYVNVAAGPSWQSMDVDKVELDTSAAGATATRCAGSDSAAFAVKGGVGAELTLVSGSMFWVEGGPDYYRFSEEVLDGCEVGAGEAGLVGFRAGFAVGFEKTKKKIEPPPAPPKDTDLDTIVDTEDACPDVAGLPNTDPTKNGCPPPKDSDSDGIVDELDACKTEAGPPNTDPTKNGCPPRDTDGDTVLDDVDACKDLPGVVTTEPTTNGCPGDTDGDGFRDDQDACPQEKGVDDPDPSKRGCPKLVRVTATEIIILEQVQFDTGKSTIKAVSDPLLDSVAQVLKEHPEILKIEVQGHTDNKGSKQLNKKLSGDRAASVLKALEKRGIESSRLAAQGYGQDKPIADNKDEEGRAKNRRVQFVVLEKAPPKGPAGAQPQPAPTPAPAPQPVDPAAAKPDAKPADAKPADAKPADAKPADAKPPAPAKPKPVAPAAPLRGPRAPK